MGKHPHTHDWDAVTGWDLATIAQHYIDKHDNVGGALSPLENGAVRLRGLKLLLRDHQAMHFGRGDGTHPPIELVDEYLLKLVRDPNSV